MFIVRDYEQLEICWLVVGSYSQQAYFTPTLTHKYIIMKEELHQLCLEKLAANIQQLEQAMQDIQRAANEETKSSAGDKYETGRAMMQQEKDKLMARLETNLSQRNQFNQLKPAQTKERVEWGSLVQTNEGYFYFAAALGRVQMGGQKYFVMSLDSPLAKALLGKRAGEMVHFQGRKIRILDIS